MTGGCPWSPLQQQEAWMLTSMWENDTTVLQYAYCQDIMDGRGYTSGRAGFCTGCGDAFQVVQCFDQAYSGSGNRLSKYASTLMTLTSGSTSSLDAIGSDAGTTYCTDWATSSADSTSGPLFNGCQDQLVVSTYQKLACSDAHGWGITTALFLAELYDAEINHGEPDVFNMLNQAGGQANVKMSTALSQTDESNLLHAFLTVRVGVLAADPTWTTSVDRVAVYERERLAGNFDLSQPITTDAHAFTYWPNMALHATSYSICTLTPNGSTIQVTGNSRCTG
jgi:chitosanase